MIRKAYIILVHKNPIQVCRLIKKLDDDHSVFFIHIDKKINIAQFKNLLQIDDKIRFVKRVKTDWASYGLVTATLNALKEIKNAGEHFQQIILLSGQDYPIKSNSFIDEFFRHSEYSLFIEYFQIPNYKKWQPRGGLYRIDKYYFGAKLYQKYAAKAVNLLAMNFSALKRKLPDNLIPYAGSQWWMIDMYALNYILDFINSHPQYVSFHRFTFAADEVFFQTILLNAKDEQLLKRIANYNKRFIKHNSEKPHPEILTAKDLIAISNSDALLARKFDEKVDSEIFNLIDTHCLNEN